MEKLSQTKHEFVADNRIRIYRMGKKHTVISDTESITEDTEFATDYERIEPTKTKLTPKEIQQLDLKAEWNEEIIPIVFNKNLDSPAIQEVNKRLKKEGQKLVLENCKDLISHQYMEMEREEGLLGLRKLIKKKPFFSVLPRNLMRLLQHQ